MVPTFKGAVLAGQVVTVDSVAGAAHVVR